MVLLQKIITIYQQQLHQIKSEMQLVFNEYINDRQNAILKQKFDDLRNKYNHEFERYQRHRINKFLNSIEEYDLLHRGGKVISHIARINKANDDDGPLDLNGVDVTSNEKKCQAFYDYYKNFFKFQRNIIKTLNFSYINDRIEQIRNQIKTQKELNIALNKQFSIKEVQDYVNGTKFKKKMNKTTHWDKKSNRFIKALAKYDCGELVLLLNIILKKGIPKKWKTDRLTPLLKKLPTNVMKNWRPIMIQSCLFKLLDALL